MPGGTESGSTAARLPEEKTVNSSRVNSTRASSNGVESSSATSNGQKSSSVQTSAQCSTSLHGEQKAVDHSSVNRISTNRSIV